ncbi:MAG: DUF4129 domain-containing protein, partial [bacterium]|nr:DUF4129 domain-containing protein [bacterium]
ERGEVQAADATILYERALALVKRRGIEKPAWMTPLEFARVTPPGKMAEVLKQMTFAYNDLRFGGQKQAAARMVLLLGELEEAARR